jgi:hypothetical protein
MFCKEYFRCNIRMWKHLRNNKCPIKGSCLDFESGYIDFTSVLRMWADLKSRARHAAPVAVTSVPTAAPCAVAHCLMQRNTSHILHNVCMLRLKFKCHRPWCGKCASASMPPIISGNSDCVGNPRLALLVYTQKKLKKAVRFRERGAVGLHCV